MSLGSNLGDRAAQLNEAVARIGSALGAVTAVSTVHETAAWPPGSGQPDFLNLCIRLETGLDAAALLQSVLAVEKEMGRVRELKWGPRKIDIDILFYDDAVIETEGLHIPHPLLVERDFVLAPLSEIAPQLKHPASGETVAELYEKLNRKQGPA